MFSLTATYKNLLILVSICTNKTKTILAFCDNSAIF